VKDYFAWVESSQAKTFLVFCELGDTAGKKPLGIVFKRNPGSNVSMCEWCHTIGGGDGVGLLTATASSYRKVGVHVCSDLSCAEKIIATVDTGMRRQRVRAVIERMSKFVRQNLF
jgi:hypothetical protein